MKQPKRELIILTEPKEPTESDSELPVSDDDILKVAASESDSEADLPLFQTKKYLAKLKKDELDLKKKKKVPVPKKQPVRKVYEQE
jgi:hypothetical protein